MLVEKKHSGTVNMLYTNVVELYRGEEAWRLLSMDSFLQGWDRLYNACPWSTVFQSRAFVCTWYHTYRQKFEPVLVANFEDDVLIGLLTLTVPVSADRKKVVTGAGRFEAVYQPWLTEEWNGERFIKKALTRVLKWFPNHSIRLKFLPSHVPLQWVNEPHWKRRCVLQPSSRPLMEVNDTLMGKMSQKTNFRSKLNKLKRLGPVEFERITDIAQFSNVFNELITLYDFRQGARFNLNQFRDEPLKAEFYLSLFRKNLLHVTVLKANSQVFAAVIAVGTQEWVHLSGMIVHAPFYARYCSPGFLHLVLLTQQLVKDGALIFDLTPGGDSYKDRMATSHDQVFELLVTNRNGYRLKRKIRKWFYNALSKAGKWPMGTELALKRRMYLLKARVYTVRKLGVMQTVTIARKKLIEPTRELAYVIEPTGAVTYQLSCAFNRNSLQDLLCFESLGTFLSRWEFLEDAMKRLEMGQSSFTFCEGGRLLCCVWLGHRAATAPMGTGVCNKVPVGTVLQGFYCHPLGQQCWQAFVTSVFITVAAEDASSPVLALVSSHDQQFCTALENIGFKRTVL